MGVDGAGALTSGCSADADLDPFPQNGVTPGQARAASFLMSERPEDEEFRRFQRTGSAEALARVFDLTAPGLLLLAGHLTRDAARAEDLVQATFLQAIRAAARFEGRGSVNAWLARILGHRALDARRREGRRAARPLEELEETAATALDPAELAADRELLERVTQALDELGEPYREVLVLRLVHGIEPTAIAHALGRAPGTVRMQLKRGLERLRRVLPAESAVFSLVFLEPGRGLGAVREAVLSEAGAGAGAGALAGAATLGGLLTMKILAIAVAVALAVVLVVVARRGSSADGTAAASPAEAVVARGAEPRAETPLLAAGEARTAAAEPRAEVAPPSAPLPDFEVRVRFASDGAPAAGVGVYLRPADEEALGVEALTDAAGRAGFAELPPGELRVLLDRRQEPVRVDPRLQRSVLIEIPPGLRIEGRVVDLAGAPVPGAQVFRFHQGHHDLLQRIARADEQGEFRLRDVEPESRFVARASGYQPSGTGRGWSEVDGEGHDAVVTLELVLGAFGQRLRGRVVDPGGRPAPHAFVGIGVDEDARESPAGSPRDPLLDASHKPLDREGFFLRADAEGRFESDEIPAGHALVLARPVAEHELVGWEALWVRAGEEHEVLVTLRPGAVVHGTVRDALGRPVAGLELEAEWEGTPELGQMEDELGPWISDRRAPSAEDGSYALAGLLPGDYDLRLRGARGELVRDERVLAAGESVAWDPVLEAYAALRVRLLGPDGAPLAGWGVAAGERDRRRLPDHLEGTTDAGGLRLLPDLEPRPLVVRVYAPRPEGGLQPLPVAWRAGVLPSEDPGDVLELRLAPEELPTAGLHGRCTDARGAALAGEDVRLSLRRAGLAKELAGDARALDVEVGADGSFACGTLAPGEYELLLGGSWTAEGLTAEIGAEPLRRVRLESGEDLDLGALVVPDRE